MTIPMSEFIVVGSFFLPKLESKYLPHSLKNGYSRKPRVSAPLQGHSKLKDCVSKIFFFVVFHSLFLDVSMTWLTSYTPFFLMRKAI